jgi:hypothetical protein
MDVFANDTGEGGIIRRDGWIDLPQKMGKVRLNSEFLPEDDILMEGCKLPSKETG